MMVRRTWTRGWWLGLAIAACTEGGVKDTDDPGAVAFIWADWQSCAADGAQLLDPVLAQYKEAFVVVRCAYRGEIFSRCVYI